MNTDPRSGFRRRLPTPSIVSRESVGTTFASHGPYTHTHIHTDIWHMIQQFATRNFSSVRRVCLRRARLWISIKLVCILNARDCHAESHTIMIYWNTGCYATHRVINVLLVSRSFFDFSHLFFFLQKDATI